MRRLRGDAAGGRARAGRGTRACPRRRARAPLSSTQRPRSRRAHGPAGGGPRRAARPPRRPGRPAPRRSRDEIVGVEAELLPVVLAPVRFVLRSRSSSWSSWASPDAEPIVGRARPRRGRGVRRGVRPARRRVDTACRRAPSTRCRNALVVELPRRRIGHDRRAPRRGPSCAWKSSPGAGRRGADRTRSSWQQLDELAARPRPRLRVGWGRRGAGRAAPPTALRMPGGSRARRAR